MDENEEARYEKVICISFVVVRLLFPSLCSHDVSDLVTYQAVLISVPSATLAIGTRLELNLSPTFLVLARCAIPGEAPAVDSYLLTNSNLPIARTSSARLTATLPGSPSPGWKTRTSGDL